MNFTSIKFCLVLLFSFIICINSNCQTNTFPISGNVGIGTTSPQSGIRLDVRSDAGINGSSAITGYGYNSNSGVAIRGHGYVTSGNGINYGIHGLSSGVRSSGTNVGGYFEASGALNNYALITGNGNVGIGTENPLTKLQISGDHGTTQFRMTFPAGVNGAGTGEINFQSWISEPGITWDAGGIGMNVTNNNGVPSGFGRLNTQIGQSYIRFIPNGGAMEFNTTDNSGSSYKNSMYLINGKLGIGNSNPQVKLHLGNSSFLLNGNYSPNYNADLFSSNGIVVTEGKTISYSNTYEVHGYSKYDANSYSTEGRMIHYGYYGLSFATRQGLGLILTGDNNYVGIGTANPTEKLSVNGNIRAKKLIVTQTSWSDYVFGKSYKLRTLSEVENYIKVNQHLPDVPSAKDVSAIGISVGDTQALLLKKIEELTLYIIQLNQKIEEQKKEFDLKLKQISQYKN